MQFKFKQYYSWKQSMMLTQCSSVKANFSYQAKWIGSILWKEWWRHLGQGLLISQLKHYYLVSLQMFFFLVLIKWQCLKINPMSSFNSLVHISIFTLCKTRKWTSNGIHFLLFSYNKILKQRYGECYIPSPPPTFSKLKNIRNGLEARIIKLNNLDETKGQTKMA